MSSDWHGKWVMLSTLMVFYAVFIFGLQQVGSLVTENPELASNYEDTDFLHYNDTGGIDWSYYYSDLYQKMNESGFYDFRLGEYGVDQAIYNNNRIQFTGVYVSTTKYDTSNMWKQVSDNLFDKATWWLRPAFYPSRTKWTHENLKNVSEGQSVYVYPRIKYNPAGLDLNRWLVVRCWDVEGNTWLSDSVKYAVETGGAIEKIFRLYLGNMSSHDLYYEIDVIQADRDISDLFTVTGEIDSEKAELIEKYGGVIYGDEHSSFPSGPMSPHELYLKAPSSNPVYSAFKQISIGYNKVVANSDLGVISQILMIFLTLIPIGMGYIIYTEIRAWIRGV